MFADTAPDYRSLRLGERMRRYPKQKGCTLREMSARLSTSIATLSPIENDRAVLDLERLVAIAEALGVKSDALFPRSRSCHFQIVRRSSLPDLPPAVVRIRDSAHAAPRAYHNVLRPLAAPFVGKHMEPAHLQLRRPPPRTPRS